MTQAEADMMAARIVLDMLAGARCEVDSPALTPADIAAVNLAVQRIETWLRRRAVGSDKILTRQLEKPLGRQVGMSPRQARQIGLTPKPKEGPKS